MTNPPSLLQARKLFLQGKADDARAVIQRFLQREPSHAEANHSMAVLLVHSGQHQRALYFAQRAVDAAPAVADYRISLSVILDHIGSRDKALAQAARAAELGAGPALLELVPLYWGMGELDLALNAAKAAMRLDPRAARGPYAHILLHMGDHETAIAHLRSQLALDPDAAEVLMALVQALNYWPDADAREVFDLHRRLGRTFAPYARPPKPHLRDPDKRLRVGFISPDLYSQSVAFFAEPIIQHLDRRHFEVFCYSTHPYPDSTTRRLQGFADAWRDLAGADGPSILARLDADALDILIELAGITTGHVLHVMAARPAPVQMSAIGYPNTTGIPQIDYRLVDAITDPPESLATETLFRLPGCFLCYRPMDDAPAPQHLPGPGVTFGSFNVVQKLVPPVIDAWSQIVNAVPGSRLLLKASQFASSSVRARFENRFKSAGLDPSRLELMPPIKDKPQHLALYNRIDIALDPFPYGGTTTTCEALHMGVPVVTLEGSVHAARVGSSLLRAVGLTDLIATTPDDYIRTAVTLAGDAARLAALHDTLRSRMLASPLCDAPGYGARVGSALRTMWRNHCAHPST